VASETSSSRLERVDNVKITNDLRRGDESLWPHGRYRENVRLVGGGALMKVLLPVAVVLMLLGAAMLLADIGASALWIAIIAVGIALVVFITRNNNRLVHR